MVNIDDLYGWRLEHLIRSGVLASSENTPNLLINGNHCERIAETTIHILDINCVISYQEMPLVEKLGKEVISGGRNLNKSTK